MGLSHGYDYCGRSRRYVSREEEAGYVTLSGRSVHYGSPVVIHLDIFFLKESQLQALTNGEDHCVARDIPAFACELWVPVTLLIEAAGHFLQSYPGDTPLLRQNGVLSLIHISEPTRLRRISYAVFCL